MRIICVNEPEECPYRYTIKCKWDCCLLLGPEYECSNVMYDDKDGVYFPTYCPLEEVGE